MLLGLASSQIVKDPLMERVRDLDGEFAAALPDPQKYTLKTWPAEDSIYFSSPLTLSCPSFRFSLPD